MKFMNKILELLFPSNIKCIFCLEELNGTTSNLTCANCYKILPFIKNFCPRCGVSVNEGEEGVCFNCKSINYNFNKARAVFDYTGDVARAIHKLKYNGLKDLAKPLAGFMCDAFVLADLNADIVCSAPLFETRMKERGFNQSELLAKELADKFKIPYVELCVKVKENPSQTTLDFKSRRENVKDVYAVNKDYKKLVKDKTILVVDDIFTTGATTDEIAKVLKLAGAKEVNVFTLAHTVAPKDRPI